MTAPRRDANHWYAAAGLVAVVVIDRLAHSLFGDVTLAPLVAVIVLASLTLRLKPRDILLWTPLYAVLSLLLLTYWRGSFVPNPSPLPPDILSGGAFWRAVVRSFTVAVAGVLCAALSHQRQKLQSLLDERIAIDAALTESHARISLAARAAHLGFWHFRVAENREEWDKNLCAIYGSDPSDPDPARQKYVHPEDRETAEKQRRDALLRGGSYDNEFRIVRPDGEVRHIRESGTVLRDANGKAAGITGADLDITEGKRVSNELQEAQRSLEKTAYEVTENIPAGTYTMVQPADGGFARFSFLSTRFLEICDVSREDAEKDTQKIFACVHPDDHEEWMRKNIHVFEHKLPFSEECRIVVRGVTRWVHAESKPRPLPDGSTVWEGVLNDITERKQAELALVGAKARERLAIDAAGLAFWTYDFTGNIQEWDENMLRIYGITREEFSGNWDDYVHPDDVARSTVAVHEAVAARSPVARQTFRILRPDGSVRHIESSMSITYDAGGAPLLLIGVNSDVTELRETENNLRDTLMNLPLPVACGTKDEPAVLTLVNKAFTETFGYTHEDVPTLERWLELAYPDPAYRADVMARWQDSLDREPSGKHDGVTNEARIRCKDGSVREAIFSTTMTQEGPIVAFQDITAMKRTSAAVTESNARMNLAARVARFGFWHFLVAEDREEWDANLCAIYGSDPEEKNPRWEKFLHPEDRKEAEKRFLSALEKGGVYDNEFRIVRPDGEVRHIRESGLVIRDGQGRAISVTGADIDVTEEALAEAKRHESEQAHRAELERKLKTSLAAAAVAHEINQPLSAILLDSQMALERIKGDAPELVQAREFLVSTIARAERTVGTVEKMMSLLRSVQTDAGEVDLVDVVRSAEIYAKDELRDAKAKLSIVGAAEAVRIRGDEGQLLLAVANLLRNAIYAVKSNDGGRARKIVIGLHRTKKSVTLSVSDSGPGLPRETLARIPLHTTKPEGTGLGLFIVQAVAENHGAKLEARLSELGGAELRIVFPAGKTEKSLATDKRQDEILPG